MTTQHKTGLAQHSKRHYIAILFKFKMQNGMRSNIIIIKAGKRMKDEAKKNGHSLAPTLHNEHVDVEINSLI